MRSLCSLLALPCLLSLSAFSQSPAPLLAIDFEKGIPSELRHNKADIALDTSRAHSGRASLRVTPTSKRIVGDIIFNLDEWLDPSTSYEFSVWVQAEQPGASILAFILVDDIGSHPAAGVPVAGGWYQLRGSIKAGNLNKWDKKRMLIIRTSGPCWIDDVLLAPSPSPKTAPKKAEVLYNGIRLPAEWPPRGFKAESDKPMPVPYLKKPPAVIPIDIGRQLFVDDFLVEKTTLRRVFHFPKQYPGNPVLAPSTEVELRGRAACWLGAGGVFYDPEDSLFKMFYTAGMRGPLALATSRDGFEWTRPALNAKGDNIILPAGMAEPTSGWDNCVYLDLAAKNPAERFKYLTLRCHPVRHKHELHTMHVSKDGINWSSPGVPAGLSADYCSFYFNPFRNVWVQSIKLDGPRERARRYAESREFLTPNVYDSAVYWLGADHLDKPEPGVGDPAQLYNLHGIAYESLMLGMLTIHRGPPNKVCDEGKFPKHTDLHIGFSRDGFHWDRPEREHFIKATRKDGDWNRAHLHGTAGVCMVVGDWLYFPYCGFSGISPTGERGSATGASIGMAILRRDGFASMDAGAKGGSLTTRPVTFSGRHLFVNVDAPGGKLLAQVTGVDGKPIAPFTFENCEGVEGDTTIGQMHWKGGADLSALAGKPVRFEFKLTQGKLYAFWVSRDETGRSDGYVAAGGPGYATNVDTQGKAAYTATAQFKNPLEPVRKQGGVKN